MEEGVFVSDWLSTQRVPVRSNGAYTANHPQKQRNMLGS